MYSLICGIIRWQVVSDDTSGAVSEFTTFRIYLSFTSPLLMNTGYNTIVLNGLNPTKGVWISLRIIPLLVLLTAY